MKKNNFLLCIIFAYIQLKIKIMENIIKLIKEKIYGKNIECTISTPQFMPDSYYMFIQSGTINTKTWIFEPITYDAYRHKVYFYTKKEFDNCKIENNIRIYDPKDKDRR
jgi:hypothetical protein